MFRNAVIVASLLFVANAALAERHALIIGNANYDVLEDLTTPHNDARAYQAALTDLGFQVTLLTDLDEDGIRDAVDDLLDQITPGDEVAFVYSGHGWSDGQVNYLSPVDSPSDLDENARKRASVVLRDGRRGILDDLEFSGAGLTVAVIDACRNDPFDPRGGMRGDLPSRGLASLPTSQGMFVVYSAGAFQQALDHLPNDSSDQTLSVFARNFVPQLTSGVTVNEAFHRAQVATYEQAASHDHIQQPAVYDGVLGKICLLDRCVDTQEPIDITPAVDQQAFLTASQDGSAEALLGFINDHPDSAFVPIARRQLDDVIGVADQQALADSLFLDLQLAYSTALSINMQQLAIIETLQQRYLSTNNTDPDQVSDLHAELENQNALFDPLRSQMAAQTTDMNEIMSDLLPISSAGQRDEAGQMLNRALAQMASSERSMANLNREISAIPMIVVEDDQLTSDQEYAIEECRQRATPHNETARDLASRPAAFQRDVVNICLRAHQADPADAEIEGLLARALIYTEDFDAAMQHASSAAAAGNAYAMTRVGYLYAAGAGVAANPGEAIRWYQMAADLGDPIAAHNLGRAYALGNGVQQDYAQALYWYQIGADRDEASSVAAIGALYRDGNGVAQSDQEAIHYFRQSADTGDALGMANYAWMFEMGRGTDRNAPEAAYWYLKAAEAGYGWIFEALSSRSRETIMEIQQTLQAEGHYSGAIDGISGPGTESALRAYVEARRSGERVIDF